jgi:GDPmannose 4,6-dehydratase
LRLLEAARQTCPDARFFLASSSETFGAAGQSPQDENTPMRPATPYGVAKLAADQFARIHRDQYQQFVAIGILYNHESPLRPANDLSRKVARAVAAIKEGKQHGLQLGDLDAERDWSDARDFVKGFWLTLQAQSPGEFVFASGTRRRVVDLVECAFHTAGLDYRKFVTVTQPNSGVQQVATGLGGNPRKAETELGWKREWTFQQTVEDLVRAELEDRPMVQRSDPTPANR